MEKNKTLLERYQIPVSHLDFVYVEKCENAREMEKIVMILRSGEEGYFPDLTRCAEEKLKLLRPDSKLFRFEGNIRSSNVLGNQELKPIYEWNHDIKNKDNTLIELKQDAPELSADLPPIRKQAKIEIDTEENETTKTATAPKQNRNEKPNTKPEEKEKRIKSTDYSKWDKYDPDEEILRMDLAEERTKEQAQVKVNKFETTTQKAEHIKICEQAAEEQRLQAQLKKLSQLEREQYAENYRLRGNEYFKAKEYDQAIKEYTHAIIYDPEHAARAYNNRAVSYLKLQNYLASIEDCNACLRLEPENVKALLRLADANCAQGRRRESYGIYQRVLNLEPTNVSAQKSLKELRKQLGELAPANATRLTIEEMQTQKVAGKEQPKVKPKPPAAVKEAVKEYDLAELVKPNRVVKSKIISAAEALGKFKGGKLDAGGQKQQQQLPLMMPGMPTSQPEFRLPLDNKTGNKNKLFIQEL